MPFLHSIFLLVYFHLLGIFADIGVDSFFDELAPPACDLQYEIVEGHASEDVYVVRCDVILAHIHTYTEKARIKKVQDDGN
jgi:hypothetical protein